MGCKVNTFDSQALLEQFVRSGATIVDSPRDCDVAIVNSCSVTANADREARYLARRLRRESPEALLVFTGCYAQTDSARLVEMPEVDLVVPNEVKHELHQLTQKWLEDSVEQGPRRKLPGSVRAVRGNRQSHFKSSLAFFSEAHPGKTRTFLKIQDGCDGFCSYCLIPYARGTSRSVPKDQILTEVDRLLSCGTLELVITGIHVGDYGRDLAEFKGHPYPIVELLRPLLEDERLQRLRISSLEPSEVQRPLLEVLHQYREKVCDHWHLPLQAGEDGILSKMNRTYTTQGYQDALKLIRDYFPDSNIGADLIPGFPGESDEQFAATLEFIEKCDLNYLHVFPYSKRPQTAAARMPFHVERHIVDERAARLRAFSEAARSRYASRFIGKRLEAIWEDDVDKEGRRQGTTRNYLKVVNGRSTDSVPGTVEFMTIKGWVSKQYLLGI